MKAKENQSKTRLDDIMVAMDVVDTLRHQQDTVIRELDMEGRRERLITRLRKLYQAQGIEVSDTVLQQGIDALEQERFQYQATPSSWKTQLSHLWVSRKRWGKPVGFLALFVGVLISIYIFNEVLPERRLKNTLPKKISEVVDSIQQVAQNPDVAATAKQQRQMAQQLINNKDFDKANNTYQQLADTLQLLKTYYTLRIVSREGENSGLFRIPDANPNARNYYLIVEAIDNNNNILQLDILSEETNQVARKKKWGLRVSQETFFGVKKDKQDDGIIQINKVGEKPVGYLKPKFSIPTTGATITVTK